MNHQASTSPILSKSRINDRGVESIVQRRSVEFSQHAGMAMQLILPGRQCQP
jgi:hypothetical protein